MIVQGTLLVLAILQIVNARIAWVDAYGEFWRFLPSSEHWDKIVGHLENEEAIRSYVATYKAPFAEYQAVERAGTNQFPTTVRKTCLLNLAQLLRESAHQFKLTVAQFQEREKGPEGYSQAIDDAVSVFQTDRATRLLQPIFSADTIMAWTSQRFHDMVITAPTHHHLNNQREQFKVLIHTFADNLRVMKERDVGQLVVVTLDLDEVERQVIRQIIRYKAALKDKDGSGRRIRRHARKGIIKLGSNANASSREPNSTKWNNNVLIGIMVGFLLVIF